MKTINLQDVAFDVEELLADEQGEPIVITNNGRPVTVLIPLQSTTSEQFNVQVDNHVKKIIIQTSNAKKEVPTSSSEDMKRAIGVRPDIVLTKENDRIVAVVEVKYHKKVTIADAISIRRHLFFDTGKVADYFFLITPNVGFIWDQKANKEPDRKPDFRFSVKGVFKPDTNAFESRANQAMAFEKAVATWFAAVAKGISTKITDFGGSVMQEVMGNLRGSEIHVAG